MVTSLKRFKGMIHHPELQGFPTQVSGGNSELAVALRANVPAITLRGIDRQGFAPNWHQKEDTFDKMDQAALSRNYSFTWHFIKAIDSSA